MSFNTALSGLRAANADLSVTGNNVANAGTIGFKTSRAEFGDVYSSTLLGGTANTPGSGVNLQTIRQLFSEGPTRHTNRELDLAISGEGFFVVKNGGEQLYTRAGAFGLNKEGYVVSGNNSMLQGYPANANGVISGIMGDLRIDVTTQAPRQTTLLSGTYNLDSRQLVLESTGTKFSTNGDAIGVPQSGLKIATTSSIEIDWGTPAFGSGVTEGLYFSISLSRDGTQVGDDNFVSITPAERSSVSTPQGMATLINSKLVDQPGYLNVQAVAAQDGSISIQDLTPGSSASIGINPNPTPTTAFPAPGFTPSPVAGSNPIVGRPAANNDYQPHTLTIQGADGKTFSYTSDKGASAAKIASELNSIAGITASAKTEASLIIPDPTSTTVPPLPNLTELGDKRLVINNVELKSANLEDLETEINGLTTSDLPGIKAVYDPVERKLNITSSIGTDLNFSYATNSSNDPNLLVEVQGRIGTENQPINLAEAVVVGGNIDVVMGEGYSIVNSDPVLGAIFSPHNMMNFSDFSINAFDPKNQNTYNEATSATIYDSLGNPHSMRQYFVKQPYDPLDPSTSANHWVMYVQVDGQNVGDPDPTLPPPQNLEPTMASFNVHFNQDGSLNTALTDTILISNWMPLGADGEAVGALGPLNVLQGGTLPVNEPPSSSNFEIKLDGSTQFGSKFDVGNPQQNGYSTGRLAGLDVGADGIIFARFTNGEAQVLGQVALANFNSLDGLKPVGGTMWAQTYESGDPGIGIPGAGTLGDISSGTLEESNVDLSEQLVNLIIAQRNFQANAKTIETTNATTQTIINLR